MELDLEKLIKEKDAAQFQVEELTRQRDLHAGNARTASADADKAREDLEAEAAAHADTRSRVTDLQQRASLAGELERKLAEAESERDRLRKEKDDLVTTLSEARDALSTERDARTAAEGERDSAKSELSRLEGLSKALDDYRSAKSALAALGE